MVKPGPKPKKKPAKKVVAKKKAVKRTGTRTIDYNDLAPGVRVAQTPGM